MSNNPKKYVHSTLPYIIFLELFFKFKAESVKSSPIYLVRKLRRREQQVNALQLKPRSLSGYLCIFFPPLWCFLNLPVKVPH